MKQQHCQIYPTELPDIANTVARSSILLTLLVIIHCLSVRYLGCLKVLLRFGGLDLNGLICQHYVSSEINSIFIFIQQGCQI